MPGIKQEETAPAFHCGKPYNTCCFCLAVALCTLLFTQCLLGATAALTVVNWQDPEYNTTIFLHLHIAKTGGTTLLAELPRLFRKQFAICKLRKTFNIPFKDAISGLDFTQCNFLSFEGGNWLAQHLPNITIKTLVMLRNPLELRISGLEHMRKWHHYNPQDVLAKLEAGQAYDGYHMQDHQLKQLVCSSDDATAVPFVPCMVDARMVPNVIKDIWWLGLNEYFTESICVLAYQLDVFDARLCDCTQARRLQLREHNSLRPSLAHAAKYTVQQLKLISSFNKYDQLLYGMAVARFYEDVQTVEQATGIQILC